MSILPSTNLIRQQKQKQKSFPTSFKNPATQTRWKIQERINTLLDKLQEAPEYSAQALFKLGNGSRIGF